MYIILYRSRVRTSLLATDLNDIIEVSQRNNEAASITGLLLHGRLETIPGAPGEFVQWLEGTEDAVEHVYRIIERDERHSHLDVLHRGPLDDVDGYPDELASGGRLFPSWSMGLVRLAELPATRTGFLHFARTWGGEVSIPA
ncbi:MAG: BLUF domain-containing protein [Bacteroidota bacterium]